MGIYTTQVSLSLHAGHTPAVYSGRYWSATSLSATRRMQSVRSPAIHCVHGHRPQTPARVPRSVVIISSSAEHTQPQAVGPARVRTTTCIGPTPTPRAVAPYPSVPTDLLQPVTQNITPKTKHHRTCVYAGIHNGPSAHVAA